MGRAPGAPKFVNKSDHGNTVSIIVIVRSVFHPCRDLPMEGRGILERFLDQSGLAGKQTGLLSLESCGFRCGWWTGLAGNEIHTSGTLP